MGCGAPRPAQPRGQAGLRLVLCLAPPLLGAEHLPALVDFKVMGILPTSETMQVPFGPFTFEPKQQTHTGAPRHFNCLLDNAMEFFSVSLEALPPAVLSSVKMGTTEVQSDLNLSRVRAPVEPESVVFRVQVALSMVRQRVYTLKVMRRQSDCTALNRLRAVTEGGLLPPFRSGENQGLFESNLTLNQDHFIVEYDFADNGQDITCRVDARRTIGPDPPTASDVYLYPHKYVPSLENLTRVHVHQFYNMHSAGAGPTARCRVPIDTWRRLTVGIHIMAADEKSRRVVSLQVTRGGCPQGLFYYRGQCHKRCPTYHYEQQFNWRCGRCNRHCEFCEHWHHCTKCDRDTATYRYLPRGAYPGSCESIRIHPYRIYYDMSYYLAASCAALCALYALVCLGCGARWLCAADEEAAHDLTEEQRPLTAAGGRLRGKGAATEKATIGVGGLRGPAE